MQFQPCVFAFVVTALFSACSHDAPREPIDNDTTASAEVYLGNAFSENPLRWQLISDQNEMRVYRDLQAPPGRIALRAKTKVSASIAKVATALTDLEIRKKWMDVLVESRILRGISDYERIEYAKMKAQWPFQFVDFVYQITFSVLREPRTLLIRMASVPDASVPVPPSSVRGQFINSYDFARQIDSDHSELAIELGIDPKGAIPSWRSQAPTEQWFAHTVIAFKNLVEDPSFKVSARIQAYMNAHKL